MSPTTCSICGGACCKSAAITTEAYDTEATTWLSYHGRQVTVNGVNLVEFDVRCKHLSSCGSCSIYETRPEMCKRFEVGSPMCRHAIETYAADKKEQLFGMMEGGAM